MKHTRSAIAVGLVLALVLAGSGGDARAQSLNQRGIDRLNLDVQALWGVDGLAMVHDLALREAQKLVGVPHQLVGSMTATVIAINGITLDCPGAPGVRRLDGQRVEVAVPLNGTWRIVVGARMHVKWRVLWTDVQDTFNITIELRDLTGGLGVTLDSSDPAAPRFVAVSPPTATFTLKITSTNDLVDALGWITSGVVNGVAGAGVAIAAQYLAQKLNVIATSTPQVLNTGAAPLAAVKVDPGVLERAATRFGDEIERFRTPFGTIIELHFDKAFAGTWLESVNTPAFDPGRADFPHAYGDSGEMSGHYLAALAYQYATTRDATAKTRAQRQLAVLRTLLTMRHEAGLDELGSMNRSIMPLSFLPAGDQPSTTYTPGKEYAAMWNGALHTFADYQSRDEYMGLFYGLSIARDLFDDPAMKANAQESIEMALDYLIRHGWTWRRRDGGLGERWQGVLEQQYAWILAAYRGNPTKYQALVDQYKGFTDILWIGFWTAVMDPYYQYYKFQLGAGSIYTLLRLETDPVAWQRAYQGVAIQRRFIGHHLNAHYNNVYLSFDPASRARLGAENANLLTRWLGALRRRTRIDIKDDPRIEQTDYTPPVNTVAMPGSGPAPTIKISKYPLPPDLRIGTGFMWSVSPCQLNPGYAANPDPYIEGESLDYVLPYWQARYAGAIPGPRVIGPAIPIGDTVALPGRPAIETPVEPTMTRMVSQ